MQQDVQVDVQKPAEPSAAEPVKVEFKAEDQYTWSPEQREHWNKTGEQPAPPKKAESEPASTPEKKAKPEAKAESAAEPGAAPKQEKKGDKQTAEARIQELISERKSLEERLRKLESAPQQTPKEQPKAETAPKRPNPFTWTGTPEEFEKAQETWEGHLRQQAIAESQSIAQQQAAQKEVSDMLAKAQEKYPDAKGKIEAAATKIGTSDIPMVLKALVNDSDVMGDLLYTLADGDTLANLIATAKQNPGKAVRVLMDIERDVKQSLSKPKEEKKETPATPEPRAPKPPAEVGGRGSNIEDARVSAARNGDFKSFEAEENRRKRAS